MRFTNGLMCSALLAFAVSACGGIVADPVGSSGVGDFGTVSPVPAVKTVAYHLSYVTASVRINPKVQTGVKKISIGWFEPSGEFQTTPFCTLTDNETVLGDLKGHVCDIELREDRPAVFNVIIEWEVDAKDPSHFVTSFVVVNEDDPNGVWFSPLLNVTVGGSPVALVPVAHHGISADDASKAAARHVFDQWVPTTPRL